MSLEINLRTQHPLQNQHRCLFLQSIKEIGVDRILALDPKFHIFLSPMTDDQGNDYHEIDWEFVIFSCTSHQMTQLMANFVGRPKEQGEPVFPEGSKIHEE